jgi:hypothetical protein
VLPERVFQWRIGDGSSVVGDGRSRHNDDNFEDLVFGEAAADKCVESCSLKCPRCSIIVFASVESAANRLPLGKRRSRIAPVSSELTPLWCASAVWNATA